MLLSTAPTEKISWSKYRPFVSVEIDAEIKMLARVLKGKRILQINATAAGGGVVEILQSEVPAMRGLGLDVTWQTLIAPNSFFQITKAVHNGLQGDSARLGGEKWLEYEAYNRRLAAQIDTDKWDLIVVHDPQPAALAQYLSSNRRSRLVWRCHIDSHHATPDFRKHLAQYLRHYDTAIFSMQQYALGGADQPKVAIIPVAIDPLSVKNKPMSMVEARHRMARHGINIQAPLAVQVSRFDPWKDPLGVVRAWQLARRRLPDLQLALVGNTAADDPQGLTVLEEVRRVAVGQRGLFIVADVADDLDVRAFQTAADVVIQKSLREGFGLTVTEALWAGRPVIGGDVGGIPLQVHDGVDGYLVSSVRETADRLVQLIQAPHLADAMGERGQAIVREQFLLPRLIRDDLRVWQGMLC